jgi:RNA polymerase sigma factor (sigma-70 family)
LKKAGAAADRVDIERLITDFSRYIASRINVFRFREYGIDQEDLIQDISVRIWKSLGKNDKNIRDFRSYINKIVNSVVIEAISTSRRETETLVRLRQEMPEEHGHHSQRNVTDGGPMMDALAASLNEIRASRRNVLSLFLAGLTLEEIAELKRWSRSKTNNLFYRGLADLKKKLAAKGVCHDHESI